MTDFVKLSVGQKADGTTVHIDSAVRGLDCECFCPECKALLVAVKGPIVRHHFRHHVEGNCACAGESGLHLLAKQIILDELMVRLPDDLGQMKSALAEEWLDGIRPDVLAEYDLENVAIEIYVAHRVPLEKIEKITARALVTVEIDLSRLLNTDFTEAECKRQVLRAAPRWWLLPPRHIAEQIAEAKRQAEIVEAARAAAEAERREAARLAEVARVAAKVERQRLEAERREVEVAELEQRRVFEAKRIEIERIADAERAARSFADQKAELETHRRLTARSADQVEERRGYFHAERKRRVDALAEAKRRRDEPAVRYWTKEVESAMRSAEPESGDGQFGSYFSFADYERVKRSSGRGP